LESQPQIQVPPSPQQAKRRNVFPVIALTALLLVSLVAAASIYTLSQQVTSLQTQINDLQATTSSGATVYLTDNSNITLSELYKQAISSVVTIDCTIEYTYTNPYGFGGQHTYTTTSQVQGSGFTYSYNGKMVIVTNNHVIDGADSITVTFSNGETYNAKVLGADASTDLAVLSTDAPSSAYHPLTIISSSSLSIGESVVAIGSPYGLNGTMTTGIISALGRSITVSSESSSTSYQMTGLIQTSAPINSGNSGGPLMTLDGKVIGITNASVSNSEGLGFAVPSDTILSVLQKILG
jgi:S1-C subfamily serine protease